MAILIPNDFSSWQLSPAEEESGQILTYEQKAVLQNKLAEIVRDKLNITLDVNNPVKFAQEEAYLKGQMDLVVWLLDTSQSVEHEKSVSPQL